MPNADFFTRFHFFVNREFLPADLCHSVRSQMKASDLVRAEVRRADPNLGDKLDLGKRSAYWASVPETTVAMLEKRISDLKPALEEFFDLKLCQYESLQFLTYTEGDFYGPHLDRRETDGLGEDEDRRVSIVLFLNAQSEGKGQEGYSGGLLTFYGLIGDPALKGYGFPLGSEEGLLIAFRSNIIHEVTPITRGTRYTIVTWFS